MAGHKLPLRPADLLLARFYTPPIVAHALADWAIKDGGATVLDPSYGACAFLYAALEAFRRAGNPAPGKQIYGVDLDPGARSHLGPLVAAGAAPDQFVTDDFFNVSPEHFDGLLSAVLGNPPYIRYQNIPHESRERAVARLSSFGIRLSRRASYWAFFLLYSIQFLRPGGRLAMVLPGAFLHADYSEEVRRQLVKHFEEVTIYLLRQRIFDGTDEESVLVFASGAGRPHKRLRVGTLGTLEDLSKALANTEQSTRPVPSPDADGAWLRALVEPETLALYHTLVESPHVIRVGEWVEARIGVVTGNNQFFILSRQEQRDANIGDHFLAPIVRRALHLKGLCVRDEDLRGLDENGEGFLLLRLTEKQVQAGVPSAVREYIRYGERIGVSKARKCRERQYWYVVPDTSVPAAFVPCMSAAWPRMVVNLSQYTCTNNILRLRWRNERQAEDWARLALGTLSSMSQLSAELVGRSYGGGVLKLEPSELARLAVPLIPREAADALAARVDLLLRQDKSTATQVVDAALLRSNIGLTASGLDRLRAARDRLFLRRRHRRTGDLHTVPG